MTAPGGVRLDTDGPVTVLTIDRPEARNAIARATMAELGGALDEVEASLARVLVVTGAGSRVFVAGEVDIVCSVGYRKERWPKGVKSDYASIHRIFTDLCVMDFGGPGHAVRVISLHPGVTFEQVQAATGFPLLKADDLGETAHPTEEQLAIIRRLDPRDMRGKQLKDNPPGIRKAP